MTRSSIPVRSPSEVLAQGVAAVGYCLIALFLLTLAGNFLPPRLLSPDWQLAVTSNLVDNGAYPLLGVVLVLLASSIDPSNERLSQRQALLRSLACWACIGYLLLAPLQAVVFSRGLNQSSIDLGRQVRTTRQAIAELKRAINASSSLPELQSRLRRLQAPGLPGDAGGIPLGDLKTALLERLERNEQSVREELRQPLLLRLWQPLQKSIRNSLAAVVLAIGFASIAMPKRSSQTLLMSWMGSSSTLTRSYRAWSRQWRERQNDQRLRRDQQRRAAQIDRARRQAEPSRRNDQPANAWTWPWRRRRRVSTKIHDHDYLRQISVSDDDSRRVQ